MLKKSENSGTEQIGLVLCYWCYTNWMHQVYNIPSVYSNKLYPDGKVHGTNRGPTWVLSAPDWPHFDHMNLAIRVGSRKHIHHNKVIRYIGHSTAAGTTAYMIDMDDHGKWTSTIIAITYLVHCAGTSSSNRNRGGIYKKGTCFYIVDEPKRLPYMW